MAYQQVQARTWISLCERRELHRPYQTTFEDDLETYLSAHAVIVGAQDLFFQHCVARPASARRRPALRLLCRRGDAARNARNQLPVVGTAIIAIAAMYAVHMVITRGVTERRSSDIRSDGSRTTTLERLEPFHPIVSAIPRLFARSAARETT